MTVWANGAPKSGTHALMKCLGLLGLKREPGMAVAYVASRNIAVKATRADPVARRLNKIIADTNNSKYIHSHVDASRDLGGSPVINISRDPRDMVISLARFHVQEGVTTSVTESAILKVIDHKFYSKKAAALIGGFVGWQDRSDALPIRFEDLISDHGETTMEIAEYLNIPWRPESYNDLIGHAGDYDIYAGASADHNTWSGRLSNWEEWWTPVIDAAWTESCGPELVKAMGYE